MMPLAVVEHQAPVPPPSYQRAQAKQRPALHMNALTLVTTLHLLALCRLAVRLAHRRCPPPLPAGKGGSPRIYSEESLLLISLLRILWGLSYQDMHDWLKSWPALALACRLPLGKQGRPHIRSLLVCLLACSLFKKPTRESQGAVAQNLTQVQALD